MKEEEAEKRWRKLNEYQSGARDTYNTRPERDFQRHPWSAEDDENVARNVQWCTLQLERIEMRLDLLYEMQKPVLSLVNAFWWVFFASIIGGIIVGIWNKLFS